MSKSLGNFVTIRDVLRDHDPEVLRYFLISSHYRSSLMYDADALYQAKQSLARLYTALRFLPQAERALKTKYEEQFIAAMDDDFNTPIALSVLFDLAHEIQRLRDKDIDAAAAHGALLTYLGDVMGILQTDPEVFFKSGDVDNAKIEALIAAREQARRDKQWAEADRIRDELANMFIAIEDGPHGTTWKSVR